MNVLNQLREHLIRIVPNRGIYDCLEFEPRQQCGGSYTPASFLQGVLFRVRVHRADDNRGLLSFCFKGFSKLLDIFEVLSHLRLNEDLIHSEQDDLVFLRETIYVCQIT
ncbi:hypothetical protein HMPREF1224_11430 [Pseudomonas sp. P179]|nr:hypothetical protein HMPREF1224_11430 [Pseudomonas sp. P179]